MNRDSIATPAALLAAIIALACAAHASAAGPTATSAPAKATWGADRLQGTAHTGRHTRSRRPHLEVGRHEALGQDDLQVHRRHEG